jgi:hypothetical protein
MVMTATQELRLLKARNDALEERIKALEAKLAPPPVPRVPEAPKWAGSGGDGLTGSQFPGPPSVAPTGDAISWVKERRTNGDWRDPSGHWRDMSGQLIITPLPRPIGPERDPRHQQAVEILERDLGR